MFWSVHPPYDLICRLVDRSPLTVPTKGGHTIMWPSTVVVTSVYHPTQVWSSWDTQLARRLTSLWVARPVTATSPVLSGSRFVPIVTVVDYQWSREDLSSQTPGLTAGTLSLMRTLRDFPEAIAISDPCLPVDVDGLQTMLRSDSPLAIDDDGAVLLLSRMNEY